MSINEHIVFVYGTLRKGFWNHYLLRDSQFIGKGKTVEKYALYVDDFPFVSKSEAISNIIGEIYQVDDITLQKLDKLEEHPDYYKRDQVQIMMVDGKRIIAWLYFYPNPLGKLYPSGDYLIN